jgi:hypothetical protein
VRRLRLAEIDAVRRERHASALLFLTDRCPVGCAHCSVDSRPDSPPVTDLALLGEVLAALADHPRLRVVGISGGEPFAQRRPLELATDRLTAAGTELVVYTSGFWGGPAVPEWIAGVLARCSCVVLGVDAFHARRLPAARVAAAIRAVAAAGSWLAVQVAQTPGALAAAADLLAGALGPGWPEAAELRGVPLLRSGRGRDLAAPGPAVAGRRLGRCRLADAPVVRYDGVVAGCCNEDVLTGHGPATLRRGGTDAAGVLAAMAAFERDPYLVAVGRLGMAALTALPRYRDLADQPFPGICQLCWTMAGRGAQVDDPHVRALAAVAPPAPAG